jgi:3-dehydroquinate synthase
MNQTQVKFFKKDFPQAKDFQDFVLIYDLAIYKKNKDFKTWAQKFPNRLGVSSGEELKSLKSFESLLTQIAQKFPFISPKVGGFIAAGGGSLGDFVGFLASVYKRGVSLVQVPTTWLSAVDSAHGGKTALNFAGGKNQIGTFYSAEQVWIVKKFLDSNPLEREEEAWSEIFKMGLISSPKAYQQTVDCWNQDQLFDILPTCIEAKYKVVQKDPYEESGVRRVLNFGHTVGHVLEAYHQIPHGQAVGAGLVYALSWSAKLGHLKAQEFKKIAESPWMQSLMNQTDAILEKPIPKKEFLKLLNQDKKITAHQEVVFVFLKKIGQAFQDKISIEKVYEEFERQRHERI